MVSDICRSLVAQSLACCNEQCKSNGHSTRPGRFGSSAVILGISVTMGLTVLMDLTDMTSFMGLIISVDAIQVNRL